MADTDLTIKELSEVFRVVVGPGVVKAMDLMPTNAARLEMSKLVAFAFMAGYGMGQTKGAPRVDLDAWDRALPNDPLVGRAVADWVQKL